MAPVFEVKSANDCDNPNSDFSINKADISVDAKTLDAALNSSFTIIEERFAFHLCIL